jgi:hypothetical protein
VTGDKSLEMENQTNSIESLVERLRNYGETRLELVKLKAINKSSGFVSVVVTYLVMVIIIVCCFLFINIGIALLLGELLGKPYYGFFIVAVFYAVTGMILFKLKDKWIKTPVINMMLKELTD